MRRHLSDQRSRFDVPDDLTYFAHDGRYLVINPGVGARTTLDPAEFAVLQALAAGPDTPLPGGPETEKALAKLILTWTVYFNGNRPTVTVSEPPLSIAYYAITDGCNLRCPYCYASSEKCKPNELNTAESMDLVSQIAAMGTKTIVFTGGEPMLRKDLFAVVEHAKASGLLCNVITNATMIRKPAIAQRFAELFDAVTVSMDGGTAETHDRTRGEGAFDKTYRALQMLNDAGVVPRINHIVTSDNIDELEDFARFIETIEVHSVRLMNHNQLGRGVDDEYDFGWNDHLRVQQLVWTSPLAGSLRPDGPRPVTPCSVSGNCGLGGNEIYVDSLGDVYPCKLVTGRAEHAGNVRTKPLAEIFAGPVLGAMRRSTVYGGEFHGDCAQCYIRSNCGGGCRATHMSMSGDLRHNDRHYCRILRHGIVTQLWQEAGVSRAEMALHDQELSVPRMVAGDAVHVVHDQWRTYVPPPAPVIRPGKLLSITPVSRRSDSVPAHQ